MDTTTNQPLVSVVIATYNGEVFLKQQLDSIINQTYKHLEIIIVDDCSTDNTTALVKEYQQHNSNIKLFINEKNLGYVKNFEKGMLLASGEFIAPCDQDDIWCDDKIATLIAQKGNHEIVYGNSELIDDNGKSLNKKLSEVKHFESFNDCLNYTIGNTVPGHGMLIDKDVIQRCIPFPTMIPHDFWIGFVATCKGEIKYIDKVLVQYRQHTANVFGAVKVSHAKKKIKPNKQQVQQQARERMRLLYLKCPDELTEQKQVLHDLYTSYQSFSLANNWLRMITFFKYRKRILAYKNKPAFRKWLFCFKMFVMIK